jgi:feruloyl esterase
MLYATTVIESNEAPVLQRSGGVAPLTDCAEGLVVDRNGELEPIRGGDRHAVVVSSKNSVLIVLLLAGGLWSGISHADERTSSDDRKARCEALVSADFSTFRDAPAAISDAKLIENVRDMLGPVDNIPPDLTPIVMQSLATMQPLCRVSGYVSPNVGFLLVLPASNWNGKFLHLGCGGWCGDTRWFAVLCALHPDYACIGTDMGHTGDGGLWFRQNLQAQVDFSYRATHVVTLAGKAIVARYYGRAPGRAYFMGCSTGGYQGLVEAQRYPWDFDGIIAGAPDMDEADLAVRGIWIKRNFIGADGKPLLDAAAISLVHQAALAKCDRDDGVEDGIIGDPVHCAFDPATLQCGSHQHSSCLTPAQVTAVARIYGAPVNSKGEMLSTRGVLPGSEMKWAEQFSHVWGEEYFKDTGLLSAPGQTSWTIADFDFDRDYARSGAGVDFADTNPDLRKFKGAGGKLISYQGGNDAAEIPGAIVDYYETVERTMGGRSQVEDFFRFFVIPGMDHCGGGDGAFAFDYLSYLEAWVEHGTAPNAMVGAHVDPLPQYGWVFLKYPLDPSYHVAFTRPVYPYPRYAKYRGRGDVKSASSFRPAGPSETP